MKTKDGKVGFYIPSTFLSSKQLSGHEFSCGLHRMDRSVRKSVTVSLPRGESNSGSSSEVLKA